jgi:hypothetical protein
VVLGEIGLKSGKKFSGLRFINNLKNNQVYENVRLALSYNILLKSSIYLLDVYIESVYVVI